MIYIKFFPILLILVSSCFSNKLISGYLGLEGGFSFIGDGDMTAPRLGISIETGIYEYLYFGINTAILKSKNGVYRESSYRTVNGSVTFAPFPKLYNWDFRIGTGVSKTKGHYSVNRFPNNPPPLELLTVNQNSFGYSIQIEVRKTFYKNMELGVQAKTEPFKDGNIHTGICILLGWAI